MSWSIAIAACCLHCQAAETLTYCAVSGPFVMPAPVPAMQTLSVSEEAAVEAGRLQHAGEVLVATGQEHGAELGFKVPPAPM
jgi:hypothetical protein